MLKMFHKFEGVWPVSRLQMAQKVQERQKICWRRWQRGYAFDFRSNWVSSGKTDKKKLRQIASDLDISPSKVHGIFTKSARLSKVIACWVPEVLSDEEKQTRTMCLAVFLERYAAGDIFIDRIKKTRIMLLQISQTLHRDCCTGICSCR